VAYCTQLPLIQQPLIVRRAAAFGLTALASTHNADPQVRWTVALTRAMRTCRRREWMPMPFGPRGERSVCLIEGDALADVKPSFKDDTNIVPMPPRELASSNCEKVVERDVEVYRKKAESI
jgi:hypothetical protein